MGYDGTMDILDLLTRSGTYVLAVAIFVLTFFTRRVVEMIWPSLKKRADANVPEMTYLTTMSRWWNEVILYAVPVTYGALSSLVDSSFFFDGIDGGGAKLMFAAGVGWFSSFMYKALKKAISNRANVGEVLEGIE